MTASGAPPNDEGRTPGPAFDQNVVSQPPSAPAHIKTSSRFDGTAPRPRCTCAYPPRRYAGAWRSGFTRGAVDALRVAGKHLPIETWHIVEALTDQVHASRVQ
jgi:hypothetical protein